MITQSTAGPACDTPAVENKARLGVESRDVSPYTGCPAWIHPERIATVWLRDVPYPSQDSNLKKKGLTLAASLQSNVFNVLIIWLPFVGGYRTFLISSDS